jgi:MFS family permease
MTAPSSSGGYWSAVLLALIALCPSLINFTALGLLSPTIAQSLGVSPADVTWVSLLGNAALAMGYVVAADLTRRIARIRLIVSALVLFVIGSVAATLAPNLAVLIVVHIAQGFFAGLLSNSITPALVTGYPPTRMPITIVVFGVGFFGASTLGPLVGGLVEQTGTWRVLFGVNTIVGLAAVPLALSVVPRQPAPNPRASFDVAALVLPAGGLTLLFIGIGELSWRVLATPEVEVPALVGLGALLALLGAEWVQRDPLLTVRYLARPKVIGAALLSWVAAFGFGGLLGIVLQFLLQIRGLGAQDGGFLLWPAPVGALLGSVLVGLVFRNRRLVMGVALSGVLLIGVAAWMLSSLTAFTGDRSILLVAAVLGLGASTSVVPAMLVAALSVPGELVRRALALITLLRYAFQAGSGQFLTYLIGVWGKSHDAHLLWQQGFNQLFGAPSPLFETSMQAQAASGSSTELLRKGLVLGINDAARLLVLITVLGAALSLVLLLLERAPRADRGA